MNNELKNKLAQLYLQKGSMITQMEDMQQQLSITNEQIQQLRNTIIQQPKDTTKVDRVSEEHDQGEVGNGDAGE